MFLKKAFVAAALAGLLVLSSAPVVSADSRTDQEIADDVVVLIDNRLGQLEDLLDAEINSPNPNPALIAQLATRIGQLNFLKFRYTSPGLPLLPRNILLVQEQYFLQFVSPSTT